MNIKKFSDQLLLIYNKMCSVCQVFKYSSVNGKYISVLNKNLCNLKYYLGHRETPLNLKFNCKKFCTIRDTNSPWLKHDSNKGATPDLNSHLTLTHLQTDFCFHKMELKHPYSTEIFVHERIKWKEETKLISIRKFTKIMSKSYNMLNEMKTSNRKAE